MIELKKAGESKYGDEYGLFINGALMEQTQVHTYGRDSADGEFWTIEIHGARDYERLVGHSFFELPDRVENFYIRNIFGISPALQHISINPPHVNEKLAHEYEGDERFNRPYFEIDFTFTPDLRDWKRKYSPTEYVSQFTAYVGGRKETGVEYKYYKETESYGFSACFRVASPMLQIKMEIERCLELIKELDEETSDALATRQALGSVTKVFDFPDVVRVPCEQYRKTAYVQLRLTATLLVRDFCRNLYCHLE